MRAVCFWVGIALMGLGTLAGSFPLWKSSSLSPDSIKRRVYWASVSMAAVMFFLSQLPDWRSGLFFGICIALGLVAIAFTWTGHIKVAGRVYSASPTLRRPDRPPALSGETRQ